MKLADIPERFPIPWANSAGAPYIRTIPVNSQIGIQDGAASLTDGFPPLTMVDVPDGGVPPFGEDMNGIMKQTTQWSQWQGAGGPVPWNGAFNTAIGGYPKGSLIASDTVGTFWYSIVDDNTTNPNTGGSNWLPLFVSSSFGNFNTAFTAVAAHIPTGIDVITTAGYYTAGDGGGATYTRTGGSVPGGLHTADGAFWALASRPLNLAAFGWQSGVDCAVMASAAYAVAAFDETIIVPDGTTVCSSPVLQPSKIVRWVGSQRVLIDFASAVNLFAGINAPTNYPTDGTTGAFAMNNIGPGVQANYITTTTQDDGAVAAPYENSALFVLAGTLDPLDGVVHDTVGGNLRGYVNAEGCRAYGAHVVALSQVGLTNVGLVGQEIDVINNGSEINGYDQFQKIALALYAAGTKRSSRALEIGPAGATWYNGIHINAGAIDPGAGSYAFQYDGRFSILPDGTLIIGKDILDRNNDGFELYPTGAMNQSSTGLPCTTISTVTGTVGPTVIASQIAQQKNSAGTLISMVSVNLSSSVVTAGSESSVFNVNGYIGGLPADLLEVSGSRLGPGTDNVVAAANPLFRYTTIYLATAPVVSSDVMLKDSIAPIPDAVLDAWGDVRYVRYKESDAVAKKGDGARWHYGLSAQDVVKAFEGRGLDPWQHGALCRDKVFENVSTTKTERRQKTVKQSVDKESFQLVGGKTIRVVEPHIVDSPVVEQQPVFNADGTPHMEDTREVQYNSDGTLLSVKDENGKVIPLMKTIPRQVIRSIPVMEDVQVPATEPRDTGNWRYSLRYGECQNIEAAWLRRENDRKAKTISDLMARIETLEKKS